MHVSGFCLACAGEYIALGSVVIFCKGSHLKISAFHAKLIKNPFFYKGFPALSGQDLHQITGDGYHLIGILQHCSKIGAWLQILEGFYLGFPVFQSAECHLQVIAGDSGPVAEQIPDSYTFGCNRVHEL